MKYIENKRHSFLSFLAKHSWRLRSGLWGVFSSRSVQNWDQNRSCFKFNTNKYDDSGEGHVTRVVCDVRGFLQVIFFFIFYLNKGYSWWWWTKLPCSSTDDQSPQSDHMERACTRDHNHPFSSTVAEISFLLIAANLLFISISNHLEENKNGVLESGSTAALENFRASCTTRF